jgi:hypothetical protein
LRGVDHRALVQDVARGQRLQYYATTGVHPHTTVAVVRHHHGPMPGYRLHVDGGALDDGETYRVGKRLIARDMNNRVLIQVVAVLKDKII